MYAVHTAVDTVRIYTSKLPLNFCVPGNEKREGREVEALILLGFTPKDVLHPLTDVVVD